MKIHNTGFCRIFNQTLLSAELKKTQAIDDKTDTRWTTGLNTALSSSESCYRLDCSKLPTQEQCTCWRLERGYEVALNKNIYLCFLSTPRTGNLACSLTFSVKGLLLQGNDYLPCFLCWLLPSEARNEMQLEMLSLMWWIKTGETQSPHISICAANVWHIDNWKRPECVIH